MSSKTTWSLVIIALAMVLGIFFVERPAHQDWLRSRDPRLFPGLRPDQVDQIRILPAGTWEIVLRKTNEAWRVEKPLETPARLIRVQELLSALSQLSAEGRITSEELRERPNALEEFGFANPRISLTIEQKNDTRPLLIGNRTAAGDQVFAQIVGGDGFYLLSADILRVISTNVMDWRDRRLRLLNPVMDSVKVRASTKGFDLQLDSTSRVWRMTWPFPARAETAKIDGLLDKLDRLEAASFVSDDPAADLEGYGLRPPELQLDFGTGTNVLTSLLVGRSPTNQPNMVYAKTASKPSIFLVPKEPIDPWRAAQQDFRDRHLMAMTPEEIERVSVKTGRNFVLERKGPKSWRAVDSAEPIDTDLMERFLTLASRVEVEFERPVVTELAPFGLEPPVAEYVFEGTRRGLSNTVVVQFGTNTGGKVFVRRADETAVNLMKWEDFRGFPAAPGDLRDRHPWHFESTDVVKIVIEQKGRSRTIVRNDRFEWTLAPGSQGIINPFALEEALHRVGELEAVFWSDETDPAKLGFAEVAHRVTFGLKPRGGEKREYILEFGKPSQYGNPFAAAVVGGERRVFEFPWPLHQEFVRRDLSILPY
jgi:hypothetical protein